MDTLDKKSIRNVMLEYIKQEKKEVNIYLFFDLLQMSHQIISMISPKNVIILVGETPSYLYPFLKQYENTVFIFNFSNKPYLLVDYPNGDLRGLDCIDNNDEQNRVIKDRERFMSDNSEVIHDATLTEKYYFEYLDTKTILTRQYIKDNWNEIILIDHSAGQSISGVSVFFNRYVGNITGKICNIKKCIPMKFINLRNRNSVNINPELYKSAFEVMHKNVYANYNPKLIIVLGNIIFFHYYDFLVYESFPRVTCDYPASVWKNPPFFYKEGLVVIDTFHIIAKSIYQFTSSNESNDDITEKLFEMVNRLHFAKEYLSKYNTLSKKESLDKLFRKINNDVLIAKYDNLY